MSVPIPSNTRDFKIALGRAILVGLFASIDMEVPDYVMRNAPTQHHIDAAEKWCEHYSSELQGLAEIARRAQRSGENARTSITSDYINDLDGISTFLSTVQPRYIADIFISGMAEEDPQNFLQLLEQIGSLSGGR